MLPTLAEAKYKAFISYSHSDEKWAKWLHRALETYVVHKRLVGMETSAGEVPSKIAPVFRDRDELASATDLSTLINRALSVSSALIVICSPAAARSPWVNEEILSFKRMGGEQRIFCLIAGGEPYASAHPDTAEQECFPEALRYQLGSDGNLSDVEAEPIASDVRPGKDGKENAKLKLIAGILAIGFDDLRQREALRRQRRMALIASGSLAGMLVALGLAGAAIVARNEAQEQRRIAVIEAEKAQQTTDFLVQLFSVSDPSEARGNTVTAREILDKAARRIENELANQPEIQAALTGTIGEVYTSLGLYNEALPLLESSLANRRALESTADKELTDSLNRIARVATEKADYEQAKALYLESIQLSDDADAPDALADSYAGLAELYFRMGQYEQARPLLKDVLDLRVKTFGPQSPEAADAIEELGLSHFDLGELERAEELLKQSLALRRKLYQGTIHPQLAENLNSLASVYYREGKLAEARTLLTESLGMYQKLLGDIHPDLASIYNNLAMLNHDQKDLENAEAMYREALRQQEKIHGEEHPEVARSYNNLAYLLYDRDHHQQAIELVEKALQIARTTQGNQHKDVARYTGTLGRWLAERREYSSAIPLLSESITLKEKYYSSGHPSLLMTRFDLAESLVGANKLEQALRQAKATYEQLQEHPAEQDWLGLASASAYGDLLSRKGNLSGGEHLLQHAYEGLTKADDVRDGYVRKSLLRLIDHYLRAGQEPKARELETALLSMKE